MTFSHCDKEAKTGIFDMADDDPESVERMISYMYTMDYEDGQDNEVALVKDLDVFSSTKKVKNGRKSIRVSMNPLLINTRVFIIGDKYDVKGLKDLAMTKYIAAISSYWNSASLVASLKLLYEETPTSERRLKDVAIKAAREHIKLLVDNEEFATLCKKQGEIAFDVLKASIIPLEALEELCEGCSGYTQAHKVSPFNSSRTTHCQSCGRSFQICY
jgi:uncharacterized Zn ribbon protein